MKVFIDDTAKLIAAVDYTIGKYGKEPWFPAALQKIITKYLMLVDEESGKNLLRRDPKLLKPLTFSLLKKKDDYYYSNDDYYYSNDGSSNNNGYYSYRYTGHHYIINHIEKYSHAINKVYSYQYICLYLLFIIVIVIILMASNKK